MTPEELKAREMGELTNSVKNTNVILERMEDKLDSAIETVSSHNTTIAMLTRISSENSGTIKALQVVIVGQDGKDGLIRNVNELTRFKENCERLEDENRKGWKETFFKSIQWVIVTILTLLFGYHTLKTK